MLRKAISRTSGYVSAMTNLGVTLQANHKVNSRNIALSFELIFPSSLFSLRAYSTMKTKDKTCSPLAL